LKNKKGLRFGVDQEAQVDREISCRAVFLIRIRIRNPDPDPPDPPLLGLPDPDPIVRGMDPDPETSIIKQK
jgi:hypothetical protein